jgi:hypothetical protein
VAKSLARFGAGRSILLDKNGVVIAGNKTVEQARAAGMTKLHVVQSDGTGLVAVQRTDLDLSVDGTARALGIADNRTAEVDLTWDPTILDQLRKDDPSALVDLFTDAEVAELVNAIPPENKPIDEAAMANTANECPSCGFKW